MGDGGSLAPALLTAAEAGPLDVADWFTSAAERAKASAEAGTHARGFPIFGPSK